MSLIAPNTCSTCVFKQRSDNNELFCRRHPPAAFPVMGMTKQGPQIIGFSSAYPKVNDDWWCGEHPKLKSLSIGVVPVGSPSIHDSAGRS